MWAWHSSVQTYRLDAAQHKLVIHILLFFPGDSKEVKGIELKERTIIVQLKVRKLIKNLLNSSSADVSIEMVQNVRQKLKPLLHKS